jgi:hypothetical protein
VKGKVGCDAETARTGATGRGCEVDSTALTNFDKGLCMSHARFYDLQHWSYQKELIMGATKRLLDEDAAATCSECGASMSLNSDGELECDNFSDNCMMSVDAISEITVKGNLRRRAARLRLR